MIDREDLHYNEDFGRFDIVQKLTSTDPVERHTAMQLVADLERLLIVGNAESMEFQRTFRDCQMRYEDIRTEEKE